jgi:hypothetical protein
MDLYIHAAPGFKFSLSSPALACFYTSQFSLRKFFTFHTSAYATHSLVFICGVLVFCLLGNIILFSFSIYMLIKLASPPSEEGIERHWNPKIQFNLIFHGAF